MKKIISLGLVILLSGSNLSILAEGSTKNKKSTSNNSTALAVYSPKNLGITSESSSPTTSSPAHVVAAAPKVQTPTTIQQDVTSKPTTTNTQTNNTQTNICPPTPTCTPTKQIENHYYHNYNTPLFSPYFYHSPYHSDIHALLAIGGLFANIINTIISRLRNNNYQTTKTVTIIEQEPTDTEYYYQQPQTNKKSGSFLKTALRTTGKVVLYTAITIAILYGLDCAQAYLANNNVNISLNNLKLNIPTSSHWCKTAFCSLTNNGYKFGTFRDSINTFANNAVTQVQNWIH